MILRKQTRTQATGLCTPTEVPMYDDDYDGIDEDLPIIDLDEEDRE